MKIPKADEKLMAAESVRLALTWMTLCREYLCASIEISPEDADAAAIGMPRARSKA